MSVGKSLPSLLPHPTLLTPTCSGATGYGGETSEGSGGGGEGGHKERIQQWIQQQASGFLEKWAEVSSSHPTHAIITRLEEATQGLDYKSPTCLAALDVSGLPR